ncbi:MAG TPA: hypothetical protein VHJ17_15910, partial [Thermomonospora sp.]|nr:hypothetical protein [Thermomonospora sp.]
LAAAQRAAHRPVGGYLFVDADLPVHRRPDDGHGHGHAHRGAVPVPADWPEAPCGYVGTGDVQDAAARQARLRGWPVTTRAGRTDQEIARALGELLPAL